MKNIAEKTNIKRIVVKCANFWMDELEIDSEIFDDVYLEAATRAIENKKKSLEKFDITVFLECWEKKDFAKPNKHFCYNTYYVLINSGMHENAEIFRSNCIKINKIDLRLENLKGDNDESPDLRENNGNANS